MALSPKQEHEILRYYFAEQWRVGTIARQLGLHHSMVDRVIAQAGIPKPERAQRGFALLYTVQQRKDRLPS